MAIVGVAGESNTTGAGNPSMLRASGTTERKASTFAAYPPSVRTKLSSPIGVGCKNSSLRDPPIAPASACTITYSSPSLSKMRS